MATESVPELELTEILGILAEIIRDHDTPARERLAAIEKWRSLKDSEPVEGVLASLRSRRPASS